MKLIICLGNPEIQYEKTRHNFGFLFADAFLKIHKDNFGAFEDKPKLNAEISEGKIGKDKIILAKPQTFMNKSGLAAGALAKYFKVKPENIVVVHDDADILFSEFKISFNKSSAGHKGVESVIKSLKTQKLWRLRFGIQPFKKKRISAMEIVLKKFTPKEEKELQKMFKKASELLLERLNVHSTK